MLKSKNTFTARQQKNAFVQQNVNAEQRLVEYNVDVQFGKFVDNFHPTFVDIDMTEIDLFTL